MRNLWLPLGHNGIIWIRILKAAPINQSWNFPMNYLNQFQKKKIKVGNNQNLREFIRNWYGGRRK